MVAAANERLQQDLPMAGLVVIPWELAVGRSISEIADLIQRSDLRRWPEVVQFLPAHSGG